MLDRQAKVDELQLDNTPSNKPKARRQRGKERLKLLLAATDQLVSERDLGEISLQHIAERADIPLSSVYHFFPNRETAFFMLARQYADDFERLSEAAVTRRPESWQAYLTDRVRASADYCNANPGVMRLLLGPYFSRELRRDHVSSISDVAAMRVRALNYFFRMPDIENMVDCMVTAVAAVDGILSLSYALHGKITEHYAEESSRAAVAYLRLFLPEIVPPRDGDDPDV